MGKRVTRLTRGNKGKQRVTNKTSRKRGKKGGKRVTRGNEENNR